MNKILIEGIGGIGGYIAGKLIENGLDVTLVSNNQNITDVINTMGIRIKQSDGNIQTIKTICYTQISDVKDTKFDVVLLIMKATGVIEAARNSLSLLTENGYLVTMQNGVVEDSVSEIVGDRRLISSIIGWGGTMIEHGLYEKTTIGKIHIGELSGEISPRINELKEILDHAVETSIETNIRGALWSKLAINCCITTIGALTGETLGELFKSKDARRIVLKTYQEVVDTAIVNGITLEKIAANPYTLYLPKNSSKIKYWFKDQIVKIVGKKYSSSKSSSLQSLQRGRKTEIEFLNGYVVKMAGDKVNVDTNKSLVKMIKEIEDGKREIGKSNIPDIISIL